MLDSRRIEFFAWAALAALLLLPTSALGQTPDEGTGAAIAEEAPVLMPAGDEGAEEAPAEGTGEPAVPAAEGTGAGVVAPAEGTGAGATAPVEPAIAPAVVPTTAVPTPVVPTIVAEEPAETDEASEPSPIIGQLESVDAFDTPNDAGGAITIAWSPPEAAPLFYQVFWATDPDGEWTSLGETPPAQNDLVFGEAESGTEYYFKVEAETVAGHYTSEIAGPATPSAQWFNTSKLAIAILGAIICFFVIFFIETARRGKKLFIRKLAGLEAIDEAIGRSTEMGRPILFVPGIMDMDNVQTLAGLTLLGHVAKMVAEYDTEINVPVSRSLVMTAGREVIQQAYLEAGRPDAYNNDIVHYLTDDQFGYVAGVNGIIVRDEPATCFYQGAFYAESLILAETGNSIGAIQIAGTAMPSQLPFFVAACDYTLIGEELFAASAYLSGDPQQLGSLKGQDVGKLIAMVGIAVGAISATVVTVVGQESTIGGFFQGVMNVLHKMFG